MMTKPQWILQNDWIEATSQRVMTIPEFLIYKKLWSEQDFVAIGYEQDAARKFMNYCR